MRDSSSTISLANCEYTDVLHETTDCLESIAAFPLMNGEHTFGLGAIAKKIPGARGNSHTNASTIFRWITRGVRAADGTTVKLEAIRLGSSWRTSLEAVGRFSARLTEAAIPASPTSPPVPTPKARNRAATKASEELSALLGTNK